MLEPNERKPRRRFMDLQRELEEAFSSLIDKPWGREGKSEWYVAVDVAETPDEYLVTIDLPGVKLSDVHVAVRRSRVTVSGRREKVQWVETATHIQKERIEGTFCRHFTLEHPVDPRGTTTELEEGILNLKIPKEKLNNEEES